MNLIANIDTSWMTSTKDYWFAAVGALMGTVLGIYWAWWEAGRQRKHARAICLERLKSCIQFNIERLQQARDMLARGDIPNYPLDTAQLNHWLAESHDSLPPELLRNLDWQRFQLDHISSKFVVVNAAIVGTAGVPIAAVQQEHRQALARSLADHVETVLRELPPLLRQLGTQVA